jgi:hypothetical protein
MSYIRSQDRMVYQSVVDLLRLQMTQLGWCSSTPPFGASVPITFLEETPDPKLGAMAPNTVALTEGVQPDDVEGELGASYGGLWVIRHTFFIDVYGESVGVAKALSSDLRGILTGRLPGTSRYLYLTDYSLNPPSPAAGHMLRFEDVEVDRPLGGTGKLRWEVVKATAVHEYNAEENEVARYGLNLGEVGLRAVPAVEVELS